MAKPAVVRLERQPLNMLPRHEQAPPRVARGHSAMNALLLALGLFAGWSVVGAAVLALVRAETSELRIVLAAPAIGSAVTALAAFSLSKAGVAVQDCAVPIAVTLLVASAIVLAIRRPEVHPGVLAVVGVCVAGLLLAGWPMFSLGYRWLGNGNDDMSNYVLSAQELLKYGLLSHLDVTGLIQGRDYATTLSWLHITGGRPGSDILLAFVSRVAGRPPYQTFMPLILAFSLSGASAVGALAMQVAQRWWAAALAAGLVLVSPLATYGVLQQLLAQVWGIGLVGALFALLMRPELHGGRGPRVREVIPIGILAGALVLGYVELVPTMGLAYVVYVAILGARRQLTISALARLWLPALAIVVVLLNTYFFTELSFLRGQVTHGLGAASNPPLFGYILVPSALPGVVGLQMLPPGSPAPRLDLTIVLAALLLVGAFIGSVVSARRGASFAVVVVVEAGLGALLALKNSDFGLFKLSMYVQPFLAVAVAVWLSGAVRRVARVVAVALLIPLVIAGLSTQRAYVKASKEPTVAPGLASSELIPAFHSLSNRRSQPVVSVTENPVLIKLEAASAAGRQVYFQSRNVFAPFLAEYEKISRSARTQVDRVLRSGPWASRSFHFLDKTGSQDFFEENVSASRALASGRCNLTLPGSNEVPFNRYSLATSSPYLVEMPCTAPHNLLAFTSSNLGESFYLPNSRKSVSFYQLQPDPLFTGQTMASFGRYALFAVLGSTPGARLAIEMTDTLNHDGVNRLPPAAVVGSTRIHLPLQGRGSARVFSRPLKPQIIAGTPYVLLDMGVDGRLPTIGRPGLQDIYGRSVPTDPRFITAYVRDISLLSSTTYRRLHPPMALRSFPAGLQNPNLEYSGLYEDGWMGADGYVRLAGGRAADLVVQGQVPAGAGQILELLVNARRVAVVPAVPGVLNVRVPVPASRSSRRVDLRFARTIRLNAPDLRPAAVHLRFLGLVPRAGR
jgi:hypothetical protein